MNTRKINFPVIASAIFFILCFFLLAHHEMWRDELQAWMIARDSKRIFDLFSTLKYEGHPGLWHLLLYVITRASYNPIYMQLLHLLIATTSIFLIVKYSPFSSFQKALLCFGYFTFYEYAILARNYSLGVLLIFSFCSLFRRGIKNIIPLSIVLALLCHTSVFGLIASIFLTIGTAIELFIRNTAIKDDRVKIKCLIALLIVISGVLTSVLQLIPPADSGFAAGWNTSLDLKSFKKGFIDPLIGSYFPIPNFSPNFWNSSIVLTNNILFSISIIFLTAYFYVFIRQLIKRPTAAFIFISCTVSFLLFFYLKYNGYARHHGQLFIIYIAVLWIQPYCVDIKYSGFFIRPKDINPKTQALILNTLLFIHVIAGFTAYYYDLFYEFSNAQRTAKYINLNNLEQHHLLIGYYAPEASAVGGYLPNVKLYYPDADRFGTYIIWDKKARGLNEAELIMKVNNLMASNTQPALLILNHPLNELSYFGKNIKKIGEFSGSIVNDENYFLYIMPL